MIIRIIIGLLLGSILEIGSYQKTWFVFLLTMGFCAVFAIDSFAFAPFYALMAMVEIAFGFILSSYFRTIRERYGL